MALSRTFLDGDLLTSADINEHLVHRVPNPGDVYDTGWVTTGLGITVTSNWSLTSYIMRRVGNRITGRLVLTFTGGSLSSDANGDFANAAIGTLPSGWRPGAFVQRCTLERGPGGATSNAWTDPNGALTLVSSTLQSATVLATGQQYVLYLDHLI